VVCFLDLDRPASEKGETNTASPVQQKGEAGGRCNMAVRHEHDDDDDDDNDDDDDDDDDDEEEGGARVGPTGLPPSIHDPEPGCA
jgi:hypothetical protein